VSRTSELGWGIRTSTAEIPTSTTITDHDKSQQETTLNHTSRASYERWLKFEAPQATTWETRM
jgi:hypothetical protein